MLEWGRKDENYSNNFVENWPGYQNNCPLFFYLHTDEALVVRRSRVSVNIWAIWIHY